MIRISTKRPSLSLWVLGFGISLSLVALFAIELRSQYKAAIENAENTSQSFSDVLAEHTARTFEAIDRTLQVVESLRGDVVAGRMSNAAAHLALQNLQKSSPALLALGWTDAIGNVVAHSYEGTAVRPSIADLVHFTVHRDSKEEGLFIAPLYKSLASEKWISTASRRLDHADGSFAGVVTAPLDLSYFANIYRSIRLGASDAVTLVRRDGTILMREPFVESAVGQSFEKTRLFTQYLKASNVGAFDSVSPVDGKSRIVTFRVVAGLPLVMLVLQDRADVLAPWYDHIYSFGSMVLVLILIVLSGTAALAGRTRQLVRQSTLLSATLDNMHQGLLVVDNTDRIAIYNRRASELLSLPESFLAARPSSKDVIAYQTDKGEFANVPGEIAPRLLPRLVGETANVYIRERPNGTILEIRTVPFASGGVVRTYKDVTDATRIDRALSEREAQFRLLAENATDIIARLTLDGTLTYISPSCLAVLGHTVDELVGTKVTDYIFDDDRAPTIERFNKIRKGLTKHRRRIEYRFRHKDGRWIWLEANPKVILDKEGRPIEFVDVVRETTERRAIETEALIARELAEKAAETQAQFLATMSHELRTPLNSIIGFTDMLLEHAEFSPDARRKIGLIQTASETLLTVVNDVLDFSKIEEGKLELEIATFNLRELIAAVVAIMQGTADNKKLDLRVMVDNAIGTQLVGDNQRIRQILFNLLNNAIKFTLQGSVSVEVCRIGGDAGGDRLWIGVTDTGIGIAEAKLDRLFQRFSQVDGSTSREYGGSGLGLAICKRLIDMMGGQIGVKSKFGLGSTFWIQLDLPRSVATAPDAAAAQIGPVGTRARLLLVEDMDVNREIASAFLQKLGYAVDAVSDGTDAIGAVKSGEYDLVLMDIQMPGMDGITATKHIRQLFGPCARTPIVAMTANVLPSQVAAFRQSGMDGHVGKPLRADELRREIERCLVSPTSDPAASSDDDHSPTIIDEDALALLGSLLGPAKVESLLKKLQERLESFVASDNTPTAQGDLAVQAHQLVSSAGMLGFKNVSRECALFESALRDPDSAGIPFDQVRWVCDAAIVEISRRSASQDERLISQG